MERAKLNAKNPCSGSAPSEGSTLDLEKYGCIRSNMPSFSSPTLQPFASAGQHIEGNAAYFSWPSRNDAAEERANHFANPQKVVLSGNCKRFPEGNRATTLLELMTIRAFHSKNLRCYSLGTAIGVRIRCGVLTDIPAILVFVSRKVHKQWLSPIQCLPTALEGPGGVWCDVDVLEFLYFGAPEPAPKEQIYTKIMDDLCGSDHYIGSGSQVASQETYGTLGAIVHSQTGSRQIGFLTNRHVAVELDYPNQKMFHPLPPILGPGVYLGAVERATSFVRDDLWYGIFAGTNPVAIQEQIAASATAVGSTVGDSSTPTVMLPKDSTEPLGLHIQHIPLEDSTGCPDINSSPVEEGVNTGPSVEHQFLPSFATQLPVHRNDEQQPLELNNLSALKHGPDEDIGFSLQLGDNEPKRRRSEPPQSAEETE